MLPFIFYYHISHANDMAFVQDMMTQYPVISLVVASLLCFGLVLFVSNLTISSTGKQSKVKEHPNQNLRAKLLPGALNLLPEPEGPQESALP